jgi:hypothetical protein
MHSMPLLLLHQVYLQYFEGRAGIAGRDMPPRQGVSLKGRSPCLPCQVDGGFAASDDAAREMCRKLQQLILGEATGPSGGSTSANGSGGGRENGSAAASAAGGKKFRALTGIAWDGAASLCLERVRPVCERYWC